MISDEASGGQDTDGHSTRTTDDNAGRFLGQVGTTLAAAAGLALLPGLSRASASRQAVRGKQRNDPTWRCCVDCRDCGYGSCKDSYVRYYCTHQTSGCSDFCTACKALGPSCYTYSASSC